MRKRTKIIAVAAVVLAVIVVASAASHKTGTVTTTVSVPVSTTTPSTPTTTTPTETTPVATPNPQGNFNSSCSIDLSDTLDGPNAFIGRADLTNTGNIGIVVRVRATWDQTSDPDIHASRIVRVPRGATRSARFRVPATTDQIDQMQSSPSYQSVTGRGCKIKVDIIDTFGLPQ